MKNCSVCGNQLDDSAVFCSECGTSLNAQTTQETTSFNTSENNPVFTTFQAPANKKPSANTDFKAILFSNGKIDFIALGLILLVVSSVFVIINNLINRALYEFLYYDVYSVISGIISFITVNLTRIAGFVLCFLGYIKTKKEQK